MFDYESLKRTLFKLDPENAHHLAEIALESVGLCPPLQWFLKKRFLIESDALKENIFNKTFPNPVGLAAGFDKNGTMIKGLEALGFGFIEVGTVTPKPQSGNPKPRLFRFIKQEALQNAMGFNNEGAELLKARLKRLYPLSIPIGINIGKNKTTPPQKALDDYSFLIETFSDISDYLVVNISSPNTPGLRDLQNENFIQELFLMAKELTQTPILLKIAPDMSEDEAVNLCKRAVESGASGRAIGCRFFVSINE